MRKLSESEVAALKAQGCTAEAWQDITVADDFSTNFIQNTSFYGEVRLGQGREAAKQTLVENPDVRDEIEKKVREHFDIPIIERSREEAETPTPVEKPTKKR